MKKEIVQILNFQVFGHFNSIEKAENLKKAQFFLISREIM
jgi:hypothetical protein